MNSDRIVQGLVAVALKDLTVYLGETEVHNEGGRLEQARAELEGMHSRISVLLHTLKKGDA